MAAISRRLGNRYNKYVLQIQSRPCCTVADSGQTELIRGSDHRESGAGLPAGAGGEGRRDRHSTHDVYDGSGEGTLCARDRRRVNVASEAPVETRVPAGLGEEGRRDCGQTDKVHDGGGEGTLCAAAR